MASQGPLTAGAGANEIGVGTLAWIDLGNFTASDDAYTTATAGGIQETSQDLVSSSHGFTIPGGATIDGIIVEWERKRGLGAAAITDNRIRIVKGGVVSTTELSTGAAWSTTESFVSYGSSTELWGETWTVADINASNFGAMISAIVGENLRASVDSCRITVHYTAAAGAPAFVSAVSRMVNQLIGR